MRYGKDNRERGTGSQARLNRGLGKRARVEVATSNGQSYIEAQEAVVEQVHSLEKKYENEVDI